MARVGLRVARVVVRSMRRWEREEGSDGLPNVGWVARTGCCVEISVGTFLPLRVAVDAGVVGAVSFWMGAGWVGCGIFAVLCLALAFGDMCVGGRLSEKGNGEGVRRGGR